MYSQSTSVPNSDSTLKNNKTSIVPIKHLPSTSAARKADTGLALPLQPGHQRSSTLPVSIGSNVQQDIVELLKKADRARTALFRPGTSASGPDHQTWDKQAAQSWLSQFLRRSFSKEGLHEYDNLTARSARNAKSYSDEYASRQSSPAALSPVSNDGGRSLVPSEDVERLNQRVIASFDNERLEQVLTDLMCVLEDALVLAQNAANNGDLELQRELQDIAASLKDVTSSSREEIELNHDEPNDKPARMKRMQPRQNIEQDDVVNRIQDYHRHLKKLHDGRLHLERVSDSTSSGYSAKAIDPTVLPPVEPITDNATSLRLRALTSPPNSPSNYVLLSTNSIGGLRIKAPVIEYPIRQVRTELTNRSPAHWEAPDDWARPIPLQDPVRTIDWAVPERDPPQVPDSTKSSVGEAQNNLLRERRPTAAEIKRFVTTYQQPPVQPRESSRKHTIMDHEEESSGVSTPEDASSAFDYIAEFDDGQRISPFNVTSSRIQSRSAPRPPLTAPLDFVPTTLADKEIHEDQEGIELVDLPRSASRKDTKLAASDFYKHRHLSFRGRAAFSLYKSHKRAPIARDWSSQRKRFVAAIACISTALIGMIIGLYAGEAPAIQYALVDEFHRYTYLGNVFLYLGLAVSTILFWPLPLLQGRKPYTISAFVVMLPMLFPQALVVMDQRNPNSYSYRVGLLLPRFIAGLALGFAQTNLFGVLLDVFGASLMSSNPHQEIVNPFDVRRHGGGMGIWLSIWIWCFIGSIGFGFFLGALITDYLNAAWGFWIAIFCTVVVILLNVIAPETRRSSYRRSMAEVRTGDDVSRRIARGEIMMHLYATGPKHWWQEMLAGWVLCGRLMRQIGFVIVVVYQAWIYGQVVIVMILLGALTSKYYHLRPHAVALCVAAFPLGALVAIPFQKASLFSRSRHRVTQRSDSMTYQKGIAWTSHMARRTTFMVLLPLMGLAYTLSSRGKHTPLALPVLFAALIGFLSNLALSECAGILMEDYDTSDLQPGMTGRPRTAISAEDTKQRTNFSCFPRVTAAFAIVQCLSFCIAAAATACGGNVERDLGAQYSTAVTAGVLLGLTLLLFAALVRAKDVQMVPSKRVPTAILSGPGDDLPVYIGSPSGTTRRVSLLELGNMTRWTEIRKRNKLLR